MKTQEELNALKEEVETLNEKLKELTDEELAQVNGGTDEKSGPLIAAGSVIAAGLAVGLASIGPGAQT